MPTIVTTPLELDEHMLDLLWNNWLKQNNEYPSHNPRYRPNYQYAGRNNYNSRRFEDWLWDKGFGVAQRNGVRFLKYHGTAKDLTLFLLTQNIN